MFHAEREPVAASSPEYDSARVAAYASSRMPACYAVLFRVFDELHLHLPHFAPQTMLDFGSGPGTAIWAAREVSLARSDLRYMFPRIHFLTELGVVSRSLRFCQIQHAVRLGHIHETC